MTDKQKGENEKCNDSTNPINDTYRKEIEKITESSEFQGVRQRLIKLFNEADSSGEISPHIQSLLSNMSFDKSLMEKGDLDEKVFRKKIDIFEKNMRNILSLTTKEIDRLANKTNILMRLLERLLEEEKINNDSYLELNTKVEILKNKILKGIEKGRKMDFKFLEYLEKCIKNVSSIHLNKMSKFTNAIDKFQEDIKLKTETDTISYEIFKRLFIISRLLKSQLESGEVSEEKFTIAFDKLEKDLKKTLEEL